MQFSVTFEIVTPESAELGEAEDRGFVDTGLTLREAIKAIGHTAHEADCCPVDAPRWITNFSYGENFATGAVESRSLHFPPAMSNASRLRVCRMLGVYGVPARTKQTA